MLQIYTCSIASKEHFQPLTQSQYNGLIVWLCAHVDCFLNRTVIQAAVIHLAVEFLAKSCGSFYEMDVFYTLKRLKSFCQVFVYKDSRNYFTYKKKRQSDEYYDDVVMILVFIYEITS